MRTDITYLENMAAGNTDLMLEMIEIFAEQVKDIRSQMLDLYNTNEFEKLGKLAHKAKGTVSIVGMDELASELKRFENIAKDRKEVETYPEIINKFIEETKEAEIELNEVAQNLK